MRKLWIKMHKNQISTLWGFYGISGDTALNRTTVNPYETVSKCTRHDQCRWSAQSYGLYFNFKRLILLLQWILQRSNVRKINFPYFMFWGQRSQQSKDLLQDTSAGYILSNTSWTECEDSFQWPCAIRLFYKWILRRNKFSLASTGSRKGSGKFHFPIKHQAVCFTFYTRISRTDVSVM